MDIVRFILLCVIILIIFILLFVYIPYSKGKKESALKTFLLISVFVLTVFILELGFFLWPPSQNFYNPWFIWSAKNIDTTSPLLPFQRTPNISWEGLNHGDLAIMNNDLDPYASRISFETDGKGFRNKIHHQEPDVIILGDSYSEAGNLNIDETYPSLISEMLNYKVLNLSVAGYAPPNSIILLQHYFPSNDPSHIFLQLSESNDLRESAEYDQWVKKNKPKYSFEKKKTPAKIRWQRRSLIYKLFNTLFPNNLNYWPWTGRCSDGTPMRFKKLSGEQLHVTEHAGWQVLLKSLIELKDFCVSKDIPLTIIFIPDKFNALSECITFDHYVFSSLHNTNANYISLTLNEMLHDFCKRHGIGYIDTSENLKKACLSGNLPYKRFDTHLSASGHKIISELITHYLAISSTKEN